jgi:glyceraldehyde 3-phosphate dehydrogenase
MATKIGINGFGRIGRLVYRAAMRNPDLEIVAVNDIADAGVLAHLLKYDSVHGRLNADVVAVGDTISVNGKECRVTAERNPARLPWNEMGVEIVLESTGLFKKRAQAAAIWPPARSAF